MQVPQTPCAQELTTFTPCSASASRIDFSAGTVQVLRERASSTSNGVRGPLEASGSAAKNSMCTASGGHAAAAMSSTSAMKGRGPHR